MYSSVAAVLGISIGVVAMSNDLLSWQWQQRQPNTASASSALHREFASSMRQRRLEIPAEWPQPLQTSSYHPLSLSELVVDPTNASLTTTCPEGLRWRRNRGPSSTTTTSQSFSKIPHIVHQTAKSRCLSQDVHDLTERWQFDDWEYYLHDDAAVERLFAQEAIHFPLLPVISQHCLQHGTLKADLWRYLVLWVYGGIYADLDTAPNAFTPQHTLNAETDDALFVVEQYHMLSQYFMAVTPRHPLMWYAIQRALQNLWDLPDTGKVSAAMATGPHVLHAAYRDFRHDAGQNVDPAGVGYKPVWAGRFVGTANYTVTVVGVGENQNEYVHRDLLGMHKKHVAYKEMNMRHFQQDKKFPTGRSCLSTILQDASSNPPPRFNKGN